jgi:hypothetical protein
MSNIKIQPSGAFHAFRRAVFCPRLILSVELSRYAADSTADYSQLLPMHVMA